MQFISWNVNGFRACLQKGFQDFFSQVDADIFAIQETKMQPEQSDFAPEGYHIYYHSAIKKGYSGTAVFTKQQPLAVTTGIDDAHNDEGRVLTLEFEDFYFVCCYTPNAQAELARLDYRMEFDTAFRNYLVALDTKKPVIACGDLNVAHQEIDLKNPKTNMNNPGFSKQERDGFSALLNAGFTDSFRHLYPDLPDAYSWWSYRFNAREKNVGWRIDYFIVSDRLADRIAAAGIRPEVLGSDHCPVYLELNQIV